MKREVAVIMRSKNEQPYVERALEALFSQTYKNFNLYNIDSGSTDGTLEAVRRYNRYPERVVQISPQEYVPGDVLNRMIAQTEEPFIVLLNSDAIPKSPEWMERLLRPILEGDADMTMSRQIARSDAYFIVSYDYLRAYDPDNVSKDPYFFSAVACAFRRDLWESTKFYTEGLSEDLLWSKMCQQGGARFQYVPESIVEHSHNYSLRQLYRRHFEESVADVVIFDAKPDFLKQLARLFKDLMRDLFYAIYKGKILTIPYNITYRLTIHLGIYLGRMKGLKRK